ncbi:MAG: hypothetical protein JWL75_285 [Parcubacteria group bacterium]|nr:hypothetical protein [Parcubacteria group bacterium]
MTEDKKIDVLIAALQERYTSTHTIRERVQSVCLWALGVSLAATGWLIQSDVLFPFIITLLFILLLGVIYYALRHVYFADLERGFSRQLKTTAKIEEALHLYDPTYFHNSESIYPKEWKSAGNPSSEGNFFNSNYRLLKLGLIILAIALLLKTCFGY